MSFTWSAEFWRLVLVLAPALVIGLSTGTTQWALILTLAGYIGWLYLQLHRLSQWLRAGKRHQAPDLSGVIGDVACAVQRLAKTSRKRKKKLAQLLRRLQETSAAMPDATVVISRHSEIEWSNEAAGKLLGLRGREDVGRRITQLIRHPTFVGFLNRGDYKETIELPSPVNEPVRLSVHVTAYGNKQRLITARDVTRLCRLEAMRRDFVANVSHELRTPLTVLAGYLEMLHDDAQVRDLPDIAQTLHQMQDQAARMQRIVDDLLMLTRLETTPIPPTPHNVPVPRLLAEIEHDSRILSAPVHHVIKTDIDPQVWLKGDANELHSALLNLVSNAVRYSPDGGEIVLKWSADAKGAHFSVTDHGIGIEPDHIPRLTERFYRVDKGRSRTSGGTGLGLAIVKHVLQRHDGYLEVISTPSQGSTFTCHFPVARLVRAEHLDEAISA